jgi:WD40 repeat protein/tetratricopeptide (TPR) repeat protein/serine/threonine protein kinase
MADFSSDRNPVEQLAEEFMERRRRGEKPTLSEYTERYPELAEEIRDLFPALCVMERLKPGSADATGAYEAGRRAEGRGLERLGDYRILREVGRGGMGIVYEAEQESLGRHVALKVLPAHALLDARHLHRFRREARAAARLHHTNIVPVYGVGEDDGLHYYVMQFIQGLGIDQVLVELKRLRQTKAAPAGQGQVNGAPVVSAAAVAQSLLTGHFTPTISPPAEAREESDEDEAVPGARTRMPAGMATGQAGPSPSTPSPGNDPSGVGSASSSSIHLPGQPQNTSLSGSGGHYWQSVARIGLQVADALAYAHAQGTIHRDIKPSNLLLDTQGTVWVTDFGLAKAIADQDNLTHTGDIVGTLRYMAPERFQGKSDARGDIYGLGLTLYELLAFRSAFEESDRNRLIHQLTHEEPPALRKLNPQVPRDLETIVHKALARDPGHRYATAAELADDLRRFVEDKPIRARRVSRVEHFWRWCRRNPALASLSALALVLLASVAVVASIGYAQTSAALRREELAQRGARNARESARIAREEEEKAKRAANKQEEKFRELNQKSIEAQLKSARARLDALQARVKYRDYFTDLAREYLERGLRMCRQEGRVDHGMLWLAKSLLLVPDEDAALHDVVRANLAGWRTRLAYRTVPHGPYVSQPVLSPDGKSLWTSPDHLHVQRWSVATGKPLGKPLRVDNAWSMSLAVSPDGKTLVTGSQVGYQRWEAETGKPQDRFFFFEGANTGTHFSPDARTAVQVLWNPARANYETRLFNLVDRKSFGSPLEPVNQPPIVLFSPDGRTLLTRNQQEVWLWDTTTGAPIGQSRKGILNASFAPDGKALLTVSLTGNQYEVQLRRVADGTPIGKPLVTFATAWAVSPDNQKVVTCNYQQAQLWDVATGKLVGNPVQLPGYVSGVAFSLDGKLFLTAANQEVQLWNAATATPLGEPLRLPGQFRQAVFGPDGNTLLASSVSNSPVPPLSDLSPYPVETVQPLEGHQRVQGVQQRVSYQQWVEVRLWNLAERFGQPLVHGSPVEAVAFSPDGKLMVTGGRDGTVQRWDRATGQKIGKPLRHRDPVLAIAFSPDGWWILTGSGSEDQKRGEARLWNAATGEPIGPPLPHAGPVRTVAFRDDKRYLATGADDKAVYLWVAAPAAVRLHKVLPLSAPVRAIAWSPDGRTVVAAAADQTLRRWNARTGRALGKPIELPGAVVALAFRSDGQTFLTASGNLKTGSGEVQRWETSTGKRLDLPIVHPGPIIVAAFSTDGRMLLTVTDTNQVRLWDTATMMPLGPPLMHLARIHAAAFAAPDSKSVLTACDDGTARRWTVPTPLAGDKSRINLWAQAVTGLELTRDDRIVPLQLSGPVQDRLRMAMLEAGPDAIRGETLARLYVQLGRWQEAIAEFDRVIRRRPSDARLRAERGRAYFHLNQWDRAVADLSTALKKLPTDATLWIDRGRAYGRLKDWERAARDFTEAVRRQGGGEEVVLERGRAYLLLREWKKAGADFAAVLGRQTPHSARWEQICAEIFPWEPAFAEVAALLPDKAALWLTLGRHHAQAGRWRQATADFSQALRRNRRDPQTYVDRGQAYAKLREWDQVAADFDRALDLLPAGSPPSDGLYTDLLGWEPVLDRVALLRPTDTQLWIVRGRHSAQRGRWQEAVRHFSRAIALQPQNTAWLLERAGVQVRLKAYDQAADDYVRVADHYPPGSAENKRLYAELAAADDAVFSRVASRRPKDARLWITRGRLHHQLGRDDQAGADFAHALKILGDQTPEHLLWDELIPADKALVRAAALRPRDGTLWRALGDSHALRRRWADAATSYARSFELKPDHPEIGHRLACALLNSGQPAAYRRLCERLLDRFGKTNDQEAASWVARALTLAVNEAVRSPTALHLAEQGLRDLKDSGRALPRRTILAAVHYRAGRTDEAVRVLQEVTVEAYTLVGGEPDFEWLWLAMAHQRQGQGKKARSFLAKFDGIIHQRTQSAPNHDIMRSNLSWEERLEYQLLHDEAVAFIHPHLAALKRARDHVSHRAWHQALAEFNEVVRLRTDEAQVWRERGRVLAELSRWELAAADYARAIELAPAGSAERQAIYKELAQRPRVLIPVVDLRPADGGLRKARANYYGQQLLWDEAAVDYSRAQELLRKPEWELWGPAASLRLLAGDLAGYRKICRHLLDLPGTDRDPFQASWVARVCVLAPGAVPDWKRVVRLAQQGADAAWTEPWRQRALWTAWYRDGQFERVVQHIARALGAANDGGRPWECFLLAMTHHRLGHRQEARQWLVKATAWIDNEADRLIHKADGEYPLPWDQWAECLVLRREAEALIERSPASSEAYVHAIRGRAYAHLDRWDEALNELDRAVKCRRLALLPRVERGRVYLQMAEWDQAAADLTQAIEREGSEYALYWLRAQARVRLAQWDLAAADFAQALDLVPKNSPHGRMIHNDLMPWQPVFDQVARRRPKDRGLWLARGTFFAERGLWAEAVAAFEKGFPFVLVDAPNALSKISAAAQAFRDLPEKIHFWQHWARMRVLAGDAKGYRELCARLHQSYNRHQTSGAQAEVIARTLTLAPKGIDNPDEAVQLAAQAARTRSAPPHCLYTLGIAHYRAGHFRQAIRHLHESLDVKPEWDSAALDWLVLAMAHHRLGEKREARRWFGKAAAWMDQATRQAVADNRPSPPIEWWNWADCQFLRREAETLIHGAPGPDNPDLHLARAGAYAELNLGDRAAAEYAAVAKMRPDDPDLRVGRGRLLILQDKWREAAADIGRVISSQPFNDPWFEHAALLLITGERKAYRALCAEVFKKYGATKDPFTAYVAGRLCSLVPDAAGDPRILVAWEKQAVADAPHTAWYQHALGLACYRAGQYDQALRHFRASRNAQPFWPKGLNALGLAMVHHRLGHREEARRWLARAEAWHEELKKTIPQAVVVCHPSDWVEYEVLVKETRVLILGK